MAILDVISRVQLASLYYQTTRVFESLFIFQLFLFHYNLVFYISCHSSEDTCPKKEFLYTKFQNLCPFPLF